MGDQNEYLAFPKGFATAAIHAHQEPEQWDSMAVVAPLVMSTTFKQFGPANFKKYEYGRSQNPNREILENTLASLENGKYGLCFSSGLGATSILCSLLKTGDHILCGDDVYGGTNRLITKVFTNHGLSVSFIDAQNAQDVKKAIQPNTKLIWVETPTNPTLKVVDIQAVAKVAHAHDILLAVDNTFLTPYLQRPLDFGADIVAHSLTKYINGHSDVIMGALITNNEKVYNDLKFLQNAMGVIPSPFDCSQVCRSLKTLALRMRQHMTSSLQVAKYLEKHPKVEKVIHPGLPSHPNYELCKRQTSGHSGMLSIYIKGGLEESNTVLSSLKVFTLAESLGGYESLVELPAVMTHSSVPEDQRKKLKITDNLIRISVGLEDVEDLISDLEQALQKI